MIDQLVKCDQAILGISENVSKLKNTLMEVSMTCGFKEGRTHQVLSKNQIFFEKVEKFVEIHRF